MVECASVLHVGELGLEYLGDYDDIHVINFEYCGENAVKLLKRGTARRCVAQRALTISRSGEVAHTLAFFTQPPVIFATEDRHELARLCFRIEQIGWEILYYAGDNL